MARDDKTKPNVITGTQARRAKETADNARKRGTPNDMIIA